MHIIKKYPLAVTVFGRGGGVWRYPSIRALVRDLGLTWIGRNVADHFRAYSHTVWHTADKEWRRYAYAADRVYVTRFYQDAEYILRDDYGQPVTHAQCWNEVRGPTRAVGPKRATVGPVEGTGKRRKRYHRRRPAHFINAVRAAETFAEEGEVPVRVTRGVKLLRSQWDYDYHLGNHSERSWKKFRKTRWK